jgi:predicted N-acetyltransferase YhbS
MQTRLDGLVLRGARDEDLEQVLELTEARGGPEDLPEARAAFTHGEGYRQFYGAFDGDRLVAVLSLWQEDIRLGSSHLPAGQMDFVATATDYEHRGLARDLVAIAHQVSAERGDILQILVGIPYFYRQFGYRYVIPMPGHYTVRPDARIDAPGDITVRNGTRAELGALKALQDRTQAGVGVAMGHSEAAWEWMLSSETVTLRLAERGRDPIGSARVAPEEDDTHRALSEVATSEVGVVLALVADARGPGGSRTVQVTERADGVVHRALSGIAEHGDSEDEFLLRVPDPVALLEAVRSELSARLAASPFSSERGELLLSFYSSSATLTYDNGSITGIVRGPALQAPVHRGGSGVPPDLVADLVFGPHGAEALDDLFPDLNLGRRRGLMSVLFPPQSTDILTYYLG